MRETRQLLGAHPGPSMDRTGHPTVNMTHRGGRRCWWPRKGSVQTVRDDCPQGGMFEQGFGGCVGVCGGTLSTVMTGSSVVGPSSHILWPGPRRMAAGCSWSVLITSSLANPSGLCVSLSLFRRRRTPKQGKHPYLESKGLCHMSAM